MSNSKLRVYLAGRWARRAEIRRLGNMLAALGVEVTSSWLYSGEEDSGAPAALLAEWAARDLRDVARADALVLITDGEDTPGGYSGGRHSETGYALALGKAVYVVGPRENIFHHLPAVQVCATWADFLREAVLTEPAGVYAGRQDAANN